MSSDLKQVLLTEHLRSQQVRIELDGHLIQAIAWRSTASMRVFAVENGKAFILDTINVDLCRLLQLLSIDCPVASGIETRVRHIIIPRKLAQGTFWAIIEAYTPEHDRLICLTTAFCVNAKGHIAECNL